MSIQTNTLRPGLLVSLKTSVSGNVKYAKRAIESDHLTDDGAMKASWETERTIHDPVEHETAKVARGKARTLITGVCAWSAFGLLCPDNKIDELEAAIAEARNVADAFNATAKLTRINVYVMAGRIGQDDVEAIKAINSEVRDLLDDMADGVERLDVEAIRAAANKARNLGAMLTAEAEARTSAAIDAARKAARAIVKAGEQAAIEVDEQTLRTIRQARTAFLDLDTQRDVAEPAATSRAIDLSPEELPPPSKTAAGSVPAFEL